jgi:hypothetical protein
MHILWKAGKGFLMSVCVCLFRRPLHRPQEDAPDLAPVSQGHPAHRLCMLEVPHTAGVRRTHKDVSAAATEGTCSCTTLRTMEWSALRVVEHILWTASMGFVRVCLFGRGWTNPDTPGGKSHKLMPPACDIFSRGDKDQTMSGRDKTLPMLGVASVGPSQL